MNCLNERACDDSPVYEVIRQTNINLTGVLPSWNGDPGQGALPQLQKLYISDNPGLTGTLPEAWGDMTKMTYLVLNTNRLNGSLPEAWGDMVKLKLLYLQINYLNVTVPKSWDKMTIMTNMKLHPQVDTVRCNPYSSAST